MKKITFFLLAVLLLSCSEDEEPGLCCTVVSTDVAIKYLNAQGENIFQTGSAPDFSKIKVYHKIRSEWVEYFEGNLDHPKGLMLTDIEDQTYLVVFVSTAVDNNNISETKLVFPGNDEDIIKSEISKTGNNIHVTKVWINDELKWQTEDQTPRRFSIFRE